MATDTDTAAGGQDTRGTRSGAARDTILPRGIAHAIARVVDVGNLLVGIGWLRAVSTDQIRRLWMPRKHPDAVDSVLDILLHERYVQRRTPLPRRGAGVAQPDLWSLSKRGYMVIRALGISSAASAAPEEPLPVFYNRETGAAVVRLIELARPEGLDGVGVLWDAPLAVGGRIVVDALVTVRLGGAGIGTRDRVPWARPERLGTHAVRRFAIEHTASHQSTERIAARARQYHAQAKLHAQDGDHFKPGAAMPPGLLKHLYWSSWDTSARRLAAGLRSAPGFAPATGDGRPSSSNASAAS